MARAYSPHLNNLSGWAKSGGGWETARWNGEWIVNTVGVPLINTKADCYRGIWSCNGSAVSDDEYRFVHYSGSFATAFAKHTSPWPTTPPR